MPDVAAAEESTASLSIMTGECAPIFGRSQCLTSSGELIPMSWKRGTSSSLVGHLSHPFLRECFQNRRYSRRFTAAKVKRMMKGFFSASAMFSPTQGHTFHSRWGKMSPPHFPKPLFKASVS